MLAVGAMPLLVDRLSGNHAESVRHACAVTLGYLTYNRTAARQLLAACRNTPGLYDRLVLNMGPGARINPEFSSEFERQRIVGLPCLRLFDRLYSCSLEDVSIPYFQNDYTMILQAASVVGFQ